MNRQVTHRCRVFLTTGKGAQSNHLPGCLEERDTGGKWGARHSPRGVRWGVGSPFPSAPPGRSAPFPTACSPRARPMYRSIHPFVCLSIMKMPSRKTRRGRHQGAVKGQGGGGGRGATWGAGEDCLHLPRKSCRPTPSPPTSSSEAWSSLLGCGRQLSPLNPHLPATSQALGDSSGWAPRHG